MGSDLYTYLMPHGLAIFPGVFPATIMNPANRGRGSGESRDAGGTKRCIGIGLANGIICFLAACVKGPLAGAVYSVYWLMLIRMPGLCASWCYNTPVYIYPYMCKFDSWLHSTVESNKETAMGIYLVGHEGRQRSKTLIGLTSGPVTLVRHSRSHEYIRDLTHE